MGNGGVHSCHGCTIITYSSFIEDLLTAFHYQHRRTVRQGEEEEEEEAQRKHLKESGGGDRCWGRLPQEGRVSRGVRKRKGDGRGGGCL